MSPSISLLPRERERGEGSISRYNELRKIGPFPASRHAAPLMDVQVRSVAPSRGWAWIAGGFALFLRSPVQWIVLLLILFAAKKVLSAVPVGLLAALFSVIAMLLMPVFVAGLMDGCRALEQGYPLKVGHLAQGFRRNAANLVTLGGIYLVGNL